MNLAVCEGPNHRIEGVVPPEHLGEIDHAMLAIFIPTPIATRAPAGRRFPGESEQMVRSRTTEDEPTTDRWTAIAICGHPAVDAGGDRLCSDLAHAGDVGNARVGSHRMRDHTFPQP